METPVRLSPQVQRIQQSSPYTDIFTGAPAFVLSRQDTQGQNPPQTHAHPQPSRWENPTGWGARHVNDTAPFTLWDPEKRQFRSPDKTELGWIWKKFGAAHLGLCGWYMWIETETPPRPIPLTVGCMPVTFSGPGSYATDSIPEAPYPNPRIADPCPTLTWPKMAFPTKQQNVALLTALSPLAHIQAVLYLPTWTVVELSYGDGRIYEPGSLPGIVAGRTTLYHHGPEPFHARMKQQTRARYVDPLQYTASSGPLPQDYSNYLRRSYLSPGCRVESGLGPTGSRYESSSAATTLGIKIRNGRGDEFVTVAHHGFLHSGDVHHPKTGEDIIGTISDTRPELDVAFVKLTPAASANFRNDCYFQAEPAQRLVSGDVIEAGTWSEVEGMSSGFISLLAIGRRFDAPERPPGHPTIPFFKWRVSKVNAIFGAMNPTISEGICGAPIVQCQTGEVGGFFHLSDGTNCLSADLDDLIAEGWQVV
ncbi:unnamed protein product [Penicillium salamii]|nr:unnamed protein product [Penicillium salamii]CAG7998697.1 unnamed protein product [Penicillium salamii]CAG8286356.1 unnamed protein product [Penicillium salamii]